MHMRKLIALVLVAGLSASPVLAQVTYGVSGFGTGFGGGAPSPSVVNAGFSTPIAIGTGSAPDGSFFSADAQAQMAAHKARWARIEAKKLRTQAKTQ
jgi:hypothetical protein